ncbi:MAG: hypothetical protein V3R51_05355 [Gammaproteobacteria bacterium]
MLVKTVRRPGDRGTQSSFNDRNCPGYAGVNNKGTAEYALSGMKMPADFQAANLHLAL